MSTIDQKQDTEEGRKKSHLMCQSYEDKVVVSNLSHTWFLERERERNGRSWPSGISKKRQPNSQFLSN